MNLIIPLHLKRNIKIAGIEPRKAGLILIKKITKSVNGIKIKYFENNLNFLKGKLTNL